MQTGGRGEKGPDLPWIGAGSDADAGGAAMNPSDRLFVSANSI